MVRVGIIGANGYTGLELLRLLSFHKSARVVYVASRSFAGTPVCSLFPSLKNAYDGLFFELLDEKAVAEKCDVVFTALPHGASAQICSNLIKNGVRVIDLSADFRYENISTYERTYKISHPDKALNSEAVYGLTEIERERIKNARIVGNPGCYTTCSILPLYPLIKEGMIEPNGIIIDAKSGTSGAGRKSEVDFSFCEVDEDFKAYGVTTHRHTSEIEEKLSFNNKKIELSFTPHLLPLKRGILATIYATCLKSGNEIAQIYKKYYKNERFITVYEEGELPQIKSVAGSNRCAIGFKMDTRLKRIIIVSCLDNLIKGASGQAVQNMNVMFSLNEDEGLPVCGTQI